MAAKKSKAIKQIRKQVKKLNARIDDMSREIKSLQDTADTTVTDQLAAELQEESAQGAWPNPRFSEDEVEMAEEMTEDAEEVEDILEKTDR
jgi:TolA-binding protein